MNGNGKIQEWLTPALLGAGLMLLLFIANQQIKLGDKVEKALIRLEVHQTILVQRGLVDPEIFKNAGSNN